MCIFLEFDWPANILAGWIQMGIGSGPDPPPRVYPKELNAAEYEGLASETAISSVHGSMDGVLIRECGRQQW